MEKFVEEMVNEQIIPVLDSRFRKELRKKFLEPIDFWNIPEKYKRRNFFDEIMKDSNRSFDEQIKIIDNYVKIEKVDEIMKDSNLSLDEKIKIIDNESRLIKEFNDTLEEKIKENNEKYKNKYLSYEEVPLYKEIGIDNIKKTYEEKIRNFQKMKFQDEKSANEELKKIENFMKLLVGGGANITIEQVDKQFVYELKEKFLEEKVET